MKKSNKKNLKTGDIFVSHFTGEKVNVISFHGMSEIRYVDKVNLSNGDSLSGDEFRGKYSYFGLYNGNLRKECGVTRISLENAKELTFYNGNVQSIVLNFDDDDWYQTIVTYKNGYEHTFTGFSWGYGGEGPKGLVTFLNTYTNLGVDIEFVAGLNEKVENLQIF